MWIFRPKDDDLIYIENTSKTKVLGATSDDKVILEDLEEGKAHQLWKKGEHDHDAGDYFTLEKFGVLKVLTAISESSLEIKGNITMRWILLVYDVVFSHTDRDNYFTLINSEMPKLITAISESGMEIKGNITLTYIYLLVDYFFIIYHVLFYT